MYWSDSSGTVGDGIGQILEETRRLYGSETWVIQSRTSRQARPLPPAATSRNLSHVDPFPCLSRTFPLS